MAKGSHVTYGKWETRVCCVCGKPTTLKQTGVIYSYIYGTFCGACPYRPVQRVA